jgi:hypothetical protein
LPVSTATKRRHFAGFAATGHFLPLVCTLFVHLTSTAAQQSVDLDLLELALSARPG